MKADRLPLWTRSQQGTPVGWPEGNLRDIFPTADPMPLLPRGHRRSRTRPLHRCGSHGVTAAAVHERPPWTACHPLFLEYVTLSKEPKHTSPCSAHSPSPLNNEFPPPLSYFQAPGTTVPLHSVMTAFSPRTQLHKLQLCLP